MNAEAVLPKWISPVVYVCFLIPITIVSILVLFILSALLDNLFLLLRSGQFISTYFLIFIISSLLFWCANKFLIKSEKLSLPNISDHYRQSSVLYFLVLAVYLKVVYFNEVHFGLGWLPIFPMTIVIVAAIFVNALYLFWTSRKLTLSLSTKVGLFVFIGPAVVFFLLIQGYQVYEKHSREYYNPPQSVLSPSEATRLPRPPSISGLPTSTIQR